MKSSARGLSPRGVSAPSRVHVLRSVAFAASPMVAIFTLLSAEPVDVFVVLSAWLLLACCLYPGSRWLQGSKDSVPVFEAICVSYGVFFAVPSLLLPNRVAIFAGTFWFNSSDLAWTLLLTTLGVGSMIAGYDLFLGSRLAQRVPVVDLPLDTSRLRVYLVAAILGSGLLAAMRTAGWRPASDPRLAQVYAILTNQLTVAAIILGYLVFRRRVRYPIYFLLLAVAVIVSFSIGLATGMLEEAFVVIAVLLLVRMHAQGRIPWHWLVSLAVLYLVLQPIKSEYREQAMYSWSRPSISERLTLWSDLAISSAERLANSSGEEILLWIHAASQRFDLIHSFVYVRDMIPRFVPYYRGATYSYLAIAWIPRLVWSEKPNAHAANIRLLLSLGIMSQSGFATTMSGVGFLPEAYANFGVIGIVAGMFLQGIVLAACNRAFNSKSCVGGKAVLLSVLIGFLNGTGTSTAMLYGGLVQTLLANALVLRLAAGVWTRSGQYKTNSARISWL